MLSSVVLVLAAVAALVVLLAALLGSLQLHRRCARPASTRPSTARGSAVVRRWASGRATTADGVVAELYVEFVVRPEGRVLDDGLDHAVQDAMESTIRRAITGSTLDLLPDAGDSPDWLTSVLVPGVVVQDAVVASAEVQVTPELRRLVAQRRDGLGRAGAWT